MSEFVLHTKSIKKEKIFFYSCFFWGGGDQKGWGRVAEYVIFLKDPTLK